MNTIREIQKLNQRELENVVPPSASWHTDYRDTAYIHIGGLSFDLTEGDIVTIFSQYGEPVWLKLARDKETGKSRGFAWLKYEDQRSCDLAVDNLGGASILGRILKVDHTRYKKKDDDEDDDAKYNVRFEGQNDGSKSPKQRQGSASASEDERPLLKEERELAELMQNHDDDDPMKGYLIQQKQEEIADALARYKKAKRRSHGDTHHKHRHRSRRDKSEKNQDGNAEKPRHRHSHSRRDKEERHRRDDSRKYEPKRIRDRSHSRSDNESRSRRHDRENDRKNDRHSYQRRD